MISGPFGPLSVRIAGPVHAAAPARASLLMGQMSIVGDRSGSNVPVKVFSPPFTVGVSQKNPGTNPPCPPSLMLNAGFWLGERACVGESELHAVAHSAAAATKMLDARLKVSSGWVGSGQRER